jgi:hypothetical protein
VAEEIPARIQIIREEKPLDSIKGLFPYQRPQTVKVFLRRTHKESASTQNNQWHDGRIAPAGGHLFIMSEWLRSRDAPPGGNFRLIFLYYLIRFLDNCMNVPVYRVFRGRFLFT